MTPIAATSWLLSRLIVQPSLQAWTAREGARPAGDQLAKLWVRQKLVPRDDGRRGRGGVLRKCHGGLVSHLGDCPGEKPLRARARGVGQRWTRRLLSRHHGARRGRLAV